MSSTEIERKFLVKKMDFSILSNSFLSIKQGYLNSHKSRTVRVRISNDKGFITVKGKSENEGLSRFEWEKEISIKEAESLLLLCEPGVISKTRYNIPYKNYLYEVDVFDGDNLGLILAEVELKTLDDKPELPDWIVEEVTGKQQYYNSQLSINPYKNWN